MPLMPEVDEFDPTTDLRAFREEAEVKQQEHREQVAGRLHDARRDAIGSLNQAVIDIANMTDDDVAGTERAAEFLEYVAEQLKKRGDAPMFTDQTSTQRVQVDAVSTVNEVGDSQSQTRELEAANARAEDLQQQVADNEHAAELLRDSARRASNLQGELTTAQRRLERSEETKGQLRDELGEAHTKVTELENKIDELTLKNEQLTADNLSVQQQLVAEQFAHEETQAKHGRLREQSADPIDQPEPPAPATSGVTDEPEPAHGDDDSHTGIIGTNGGLAAGESPQPLTHKEELERRRGIRGLANKARSIAPGHANPHNTSKDGEN